MNALVLSGYRWMDHLWIWICADLLTYLYTLGRQTSDEILGPRISPVAPFCEHVENCDGIQRSTWINSFSIVEKSSRLQTGGASKISHHVSSVTYLFFKM